MVDEEVLRNVHDHVFNSGISPARAYVQFFAQAMRWPVDAFAPETVRAAGDVEHRVSWLRGTTIGQAVCVGPSDAPVLEATVRPMHSVTRVEVGSTVRDNGYSQSVIRSLRVHFTDGDPLVIDLAKFSVSTQREQADAFIDAVLDAIA